jgi:hypothetical protein
MKLYRRLSLFIIGRPSSGTVEYLDRHACGLIASIGSRSDVELECPRDLILGFLVAFSTRKSAIPVEAVTSERSFVPYCITDL